MGAAEGSAVGMVGSRVGTAVGAVGAEVGIWEGAGEGVVLGYGDGGTVGADVG